jgi:predicted transcriptional regulator
MSDGRSLPPIKRQLAQLLIESHLDSKTVAGEVGCSLRTVYNYKSNMKICKQPLLPSISRIGRPSSFTQEMRDVCLLCTILLVSFLKY